MIQFSPENYSEDRHNADEIDVNNVFHPRDRRVSYEYVSYRSAANGCDESDNENAEEVEPPVHCSQSAGNRKSNCSQQIQDIEEGKIYHAANVALIAVFQK